MARSETIEYSQNHLSLTGNETRLHSFEGDGKEQENYLVVAHGAAVSLIGSLAEKVRESGFQPDLIVTVLRGGSQPARQLADALGDLPMVGLTIASGYAPDGKRFLPQIIQSLPPLEEIETKLRAIGKLGDEQKIEHILVVDEVIDAGETIEAIWQHLQEKWQITRDSDQAKIGSIFVKDKNQPITVDFCAKIISSSWWIIFPWEVRETIQSLYRRWQNYQTSPIPHPQEINARLKELGFSELDINQYLPANL